jgi:NAD+ kinase
MEVAVFPNAVKPTVFPFFQTLEKIFDKKNIRFYLPDGLRPEFEKKKIHVDGEHFKSIDWIGNHVRYVFSVGGDGSFLQVARQMSDYPVLLVGINLGELGFLNEIAPDRLEERLDQIERNDYRVEERMFLSSYIEEGESKTCRKLPDALNDVVVGRNKTGKMSRVRLWINGQYTQEYPADGLIVSTPTGSTSYALSCGGPILHSAARQILVVPICAHLMRNIPLLLCDSDEVRVTLPERERFLTVSVDGDASYTLDNRSQLCIRSCIKKIRFIRFKDQEFFTTLFSRLLRRDSTAPSLETAGVKAEH